MEINEIINLLLQSGKMKRTAQDEMSLLILQARRAKKLSQREYWILKYRFVQGLSLLDVGKRFDVTRERIRQIEARALCILGFDENKIIK